MKRAIFAFLIVALTIMACRLGNQPRVNEYVIQVGDATSVQEESPTSTDMPLPTKTILPTATWTPTATVEPVKPPSEELVLYSHESVVEWTAFAVKYDPSVFADLVRSQGALYAPYKGGQIFFPTSDEPGYDNGGVIASDMEMLLGGASPVCIGYKWEVYPYPGHGEGMARWAQVTVVFEGIDISSVVPTDSDVVEFIFVIEDLPDRSGLAAIRPVPAADVPFETRDLTVCP